MASFEETLQNFFETYDVLTRLYDSLKKISDIEKNCDNKFLTSSCSYLIKQLQEKFFAIHYSCKFTRSNLNEEINIGKEIVKDSDKITNKYKQFLLSNSEINPNVEKFMEKWNRSNKLLTKVQKLFEKLLMIKKIYNETNDKSLIYGYLHFERKLEYICYEIKTNIEDEDISDICEKLNELESGINDYEKLNL